MIHYPLKNRHHGRDDLRIDLAPVGERDPVGAKLRLVVAAVRVAAGAGLPPEAEFMEEDV